MREIVDEHEPGRARVRADLARHGLPRLFELHGLAAAQRLAARDDDDGCLAPARVGNADDDGRLEPRDAAHDALDAVERDVHAARDDDVVDAPAHAQHVVLDEPGVAGEVPARAVGRAAEDGIRHLGIAEIAVGERSGPAICTSPSTIRTDTPRSGTPS